MDKPTPSPAALWSQAFPHVRRTVNSPMVWLAMQAAHPLAVDGSFFVVGLPADKQYMADNLKTFEAVSAIEDALQEAAGRILALRVIEGETVSDWGAVRDQYITPVESAPPSGRDTEPPTAPTAVSAPAPEAERETFANWDKLNEWLTQSYKTWPHVRYPHGQAQYVLQAVKHISDTMDAQMSGPGLPPDDTQERALSRLMERLSALINLDPIFLSLELFRYRQSRGK